MTAIAGKNRNPNQAELGEQKRQPVTVIYFKKSSGNAMKRLATRVRDSGVQTRLVWAHVFHGPDDINKSARAVIIEVDAPQRAVIAKSYERFAHNVEIHYVTAEGQFTQLSDDARHEDSSATVPGHEGEVDPRDAVAALAAADEENTVADPEPEPDTDEPETADEDSGEDHELEAEDDDTDRD